MNGNYGVRIAALGLTGLIVAGCNATNPVSGLSLGNNAAQQAATQQANAPAVVQGACPFVNLRDGTAYFQTFTRRNQGNPDEIIYQASLAETTRECRLSGDTLTMTVLAAGRVVAGPKGKAGSVNLPIRVAVLDRGQVLYSELTKLPVEIPTGSPTTQFLFSKSEVSIPAGAARDVKVYVGFDEGPYDTP